MVGRIATTQWSQVLAARDGSDTEARQALENLCRIYWPPLYAYARHQGASPEEARDLTQGYFTELLEKGVLASVDPSKGRFRSFLLVSMRNYLSRQQERNQALKRGGGASVFSLDVEEGEAGYTLRPSISITPEALFERRWAMTVVETALERVRRESEVSGREVQFEKLKQYLTSTESQQPYCEAAEELAMSEGAVATAVHRLRKQFGVALRAEIAETVVDKTTVDEELRHLLGVLRN